jgi:hypothetical protein
MKDDIEDVFTRLHALFPNHIQRIYPCWEQCDWSRVYRIDLLDDACLFLKGTPRSRSEAVVTQRLRAICPTIIPKVIATDLTPASSWRWFLMEDAGCCHADGLTNPIALEVAFALGTLQRYAMVDLTLPFYLRHCEASQLQECALDVCAWVANQIPVTSRAGIRRITSNLNDAHTFFHEIAHRVSHVPPTIVHGDLWAGNIAIANQSIRFLDWGDALWVVGGVSIVHLLLAADENLAEASSDIWEAYEKGLGISLHPAYQEACSIADLVASLVIDMEIAKCCGRGLEILPGLLLGLLRLEKRVEA